MPITVYNRQRESHSDSPNNFRCYRPFVLGNPYTHIQNKETKAKRTVTIKGTSEHKPLEGIISNVSPLGQALIGRKKGDTVEVDCPAGLIKYKIVSFENPGSKKD